MDADTALPTEEDLAHAMPRQLIALGRAEAIAADWASRVRQAVAAGQPALPRYPLTPVTQETLFEVRRAGRVVRGLEDAETALAKEEAGLSRAAATRTQSGRPRISRLLIVSADGSERFYRQVEQLKQRYAHRLEALLVEGDEFALGGAVFGGGKRARAVLLVQKDAVIHFLETAELTAAEDATEAVSAEAGPDEGVESDAE